MPGKQIGLQSPGIKANFPFGRPMRWAVFFLAVPISPFLVYLINLDRSTERLELSEAILRKVKLPFRRMAAVDGSKIKSSKESDSPILEGIPYTVADFHREGREKRLAPGVLGCWLSHWNCLLDASRQPSTVDTPTMILEDDIDVSEEFIERAERMLHFLSDRDWNILYLGYGFAGDTGLATGDPDNLPNWDSNLAQLTTGGVFGTVSYVVRDRSSIEKILSHIMHWPEREMRVIDLLYKRMTEDRLIASFIAYPERIAAQRGDASTIGETQGLYPIKNSVHESLRK